MKRNRIVQAGAVLAGLLTMAAARPALAELEVRTKFIGFGTPGSAPAFVGGGNLQDIMKAAAEAWERVFKNGGGKWVVNVYYDWADTGDLYGVERMLDEGGGIPHITHALVLFNNKVPGFDAIGMYLDPTPRDNSEFQKYTPLAIPTEQGNLNVARVFTQPTGLAVGRIDMMDVAMHEIGHALGLDLDYSGFPILRRQVEFTRPRPYPGLTFLIKNSSHIDFGGPLMEEYNVPGRRKLITALDAIVLAQMNSFPKPNIEDPTGQQDVIVPDTNGDGVVDSRDVIAFFPPLAPPPPGTPGQ